jgi:DNA-binding NarL/FixJ family response regulator
MSSPDRPIRIVLVDDHALVRDGLNEILEAQSDLHVVGQAGNSGDAVAVVARERPDIVLLDVEIPGGEATDTVNEMAVLSPASKIIILSMYDGSQLLRRLLAAGIRGYLLKSVHWNELVAAVRSVHNEPDRVVLSVSRECMSQLNEQPQEILTAREREVLELTAGALSNYQIATILDLTEATVKRHLRNVFIKLDAVSRIDAVNKAIAVSLITPPASRPGQVGRGGQTLAGRGGPATAGPRRTPGSSPDTQSRRY